MPTPSEMGPILQDCFNRRDTAHLRSLWTDDFQFEGPFRSFSGKDLMQAQEENLWAAFPDIQCEVRTFSATVDRVTFETRMRGTHTGPLRFGTETLEPTRNSMDFTFAVHMWFRDGLIAGERVFFDTAGFMRQLGIAKF